MPIWWGHQPFLSKAQRDQVSDWYRSKVSANAEYTDAVTGAAKAFVLIGDLNASAAGMAWQTIIPDLLAAGPRPGVQRHQRTGGGGCCPLDRGGGRHLHAAIAGLSLFNPPTAPARLSCQRVSTRSRPA